MSAKNKLTLSIQFADKRLADQLSRAAIRRWVQAALLAPAELTIRFVAEEEGRSLNCDYRGKDYATNVLTFAYTENELADDEPTQADIVLCSDVLMKEAGEQKRRRQAEHRRHRRIETKGHPEGEAGGKGDGGEQSQNQVGGAACHGQPSRAFDGALI